MKRLLSAICTPFLIVFLISTAVYAVDFKVGGTDLNVGGSARLDAGWDYNDKGDVASGEPGTNSKMFVTIPSDTNLFIRAQNSNLLGYCELGLSEPHLNTYMASAYASPSLLSKDGGAVRLRYAYGQYTFNSGSELLIGQTDCMFSQLTPKQYLYDDNGMQGFGVVLSDRYPQLRYTYKKDKLTAQVALQQAVTNDAVIGTSGYEPNEILPAIIGSLNYKINNNISLTPNLYFQYYKLKADSSDYTSLDKDLDVTTFGLCLNAEAKLNPVDLTGGIWWGINLGIFGNDKRFNLSDDSGVFGAPIIENWPTSDAKIKNNQSYGGWMQAAVHTGPGLLRLGLGGQRAQTGYTDHGYTENVYTWGIFANYDYELVKNFTIAPEIVFMNNGYAVDRRSLGNTTLAGVHFQYDF
jgi:hypothetical protein